MGLKDTLRLVGAVSSEEFIPEAKPYNTQRPVQGAAQRIDLKKPNTVISTEEQAFTVWQREAWEYYDAIGEVKYAFQLVGAVMSRLRIAASLVLDEDATPVSIGSFIADREAQNAEERVEFARKQITPPDSFTDEVLSYARVLVRDLGSGHGGISGLLRDFAVNLSIPGECYLVNYQGRWQIYSTSEIVIRRGDKKVFLRKFRTNSTGVGAGPSQYDEELPPSTFIGRIWRPHPRFTYEPDSSMLALRDPCNELLTLQQMIRGVARSRMNAGILFVPDGLSVAASVLTEDDDDEDLFEQELYESMTAPISDEAAASAIVPMIVRGPGELSDQLKHIQFGREADQWLITRADRVLESIMQGIDVPKDLVTGLANVKYSNAVVIDESLYKSHIEPLALLFCDAVTTMYLRPAMKSQFPDLTDEDLMSLCVWYDPSEVVSRPDPANSANDGYDKFVLSGSAWRRAHGFSNTDAPTEAELALRLALEKTTVPPEIATALIKSAVPHIFEEQRQRAREDLPVPFPESAAQLLDGTDNGLAETAVEPISPEAVEE